MLGASAGLAVFDGTGLSRADRIPLATLAAVIALLREDPGSAPIVFAWVPSRGQDRPARWPAVFLESGMRKSSAVRSAIDTLVTEVVGCGLVEVATALPDPERASCWCREDDGDSCCCSSRRWSRQAQLSPTSRSPDSILTLDVTSGSAAILRLLASGRTWLGPVGDAVPLDEHRRDRNPTSSLIEVAGRRSLASGRPPRVVRGCRRAGSAGYGRGMPARKPRRPRMQLGPARSCSTG